MAGATAELTALDWRLEPGDRFDRYRIDRLIARGGMGEVYEAEEVDAGRRVALKLLHQRLRRPDDRARFLAEGQLAAAVNHPHSVYVFETIEIAGIPVISMELLPGGTLKDRVRGGGPLGREQAVDAILQVIEGLEAAQGAGILHRDVKPSNCFVDGDGTIKIGDFGLSISVVSRQDGDLCAGAAFEGTPEFAAPEQILGEPVDVRSDIYSVGATLYFLLFGYPPFEHSNLDELIARIRSEPARFPADSQAEISTELAALIRRCLAKHPAERPSSYAELKKELVRFGSAAFEPAPVGLRVVATAFDMIVMLPVAAIVLGVLVGSRTIRDPVAAALIILVLLVLYWGVLEGSLGAAYGKRRCGIGVVNRNGESCGFARAVARSALFVLPIASTLAIAAFDRSASVFSPFTALQAAILAGVLVLPARFENGFAGLHEILTGTRVIRRASAPEPVPPKEAIRLVQEATHERVGPYEVISAIGATDSGRILRGWDPRLKRAVWIHVLKAGAPSVPAAIRNVSRAGRLHWLQGQRLESCAWDAYESLDGQPLLALANEQSWQSVSIWLCDLARELSITSASSVGALALERIWITRDGHAKLLDFRGPGVSEGAESGSFGADRAQQFLYAAARRALGSSVPPPPLSASTLLRALEIGKFSTLTEVAAALARLQAGPDHVTSERRGMTLGLGLAIYLLAADGLGRILIERLFPHLAFVGFGRLSLTIPAAGLIGCATLGLFWAFTLRSGAWLRAFGIAVVTRDGREVSRLRALYRAALVWIWVPAQIVAIGLGWPVFGIDILKLVGLFYAADHPARAWQDRLAGTYLVPR